MYTFCWILDNLCWKHSPIWSRRKRWRYFNDFSAICSPFELLPSNDGILFRWLMVVCMHNFLLCQRWVVYVELCYFTDKVRIKWISVLSKCNKTFGLRKSFPEFWTIWDPLFCKCAIDIGKPFSGTSPCPTEVCPWIQMVIIEQHFDLCLLYRYEKIGFREPHHKVISGRYFPCNITDNSSTVHKFSYVEPKADAYTVTCWERNISDYWYIWRCISKLNGKGLI